ncbi:PA0069 family radical SAM protein [Sulfitobacter sabulilitoris]|uniref:PA0069 family radical SAM protein n=1 Tax=Sulfitobacter sabulilitoris TaxID=2562655 RepID=A0A5S3PK06_9RHOB|nr:PA0069 family radical SAM protein [Sulfitobacter sabulilitoris]TMM54713.1 PA0069 family radical SAM protein [Sulfitobacter sabulilitoris]
MDRPDRHHSLKGRAAASNHAGRFEAHQCEAVDDGWAAQDDPLPVLRTRTSVEVPRRVITYNRSPDLPFDRSINPYRGCEHGCIYCFARPSHAYLGLSPGLDFETRLVARPDAPAVLRRELAARRYSVAPIAIGTNTDPYQPIEKEHRIMRALLGVLSEAGHPVAIVTKGALIERDLDILSDMARRGLVRVGISVTTLDMRLSRLMEPRAPSPRRRLAMIARLTQAGIPVRVMASPLIPALTDPELEAILAAGAGAGAEHAGWIMLRLPREVSPLVRDWLARHFPDRAGRIMARLREMHGGKDYDATWHRRMRGEGPYADVIAQRFDLAVRRLGLKTAAPPMRCDLFAPPGRDAAQLSLF